MGQFQNAGHQARFVADLQPGLFAEHLIEDLRLQLHNHPHTALCQIHAAHGGALHSIAVQQRPICAGRDVLHAGDVLRQLHRSGVHLCLQPVAVLQPVDPPGQGQIQFPHREFVQHLPQNIPQRGGVQIHAAHRQNGMVVVPCHALGQLLCFRGVRAGAVEQDDVGFAQRIQLFNDPLFGFGVPRTRDVADGAVGGDDDADGGVLPDHPAGAGLSGKVKGYFLVEPRTFDHARLFVFLVAHGPLHHIAHTVDEPYPTDTTAF